MPNVKYFWGLGIALLVFAIPSYAGLGPHEVLVLVNQESPHSMEAANHFIQLRRVPPQNVVYLSLPDRVLEPAAEISPDEFTTLIWEPALRAIEERKLDHVLAWIYSVDFPVRITTKPATSLMGMTFMRNQFPADAEDVDKGRYFSRLYAGPDQADGPMALGGSLIRYREEQGNHPMPVPSMMLGFMGSRGTDMETVLHTLRNGVVGDFSAPRGTVYWMTGTDIRSTIREWEFPIARKELTALSIRSVISDTFPSLKNDVIGLQIGLQGLDMHHVAPPLPGAMTEHLTSHAASFHLPQQTKLTDWLRAGATASAGTVTEPYSIWTKFPHARFFAHYARGHTMLESFYLSIRSPTQILLVGEPLSRPWAPRLMVTLIGLEDNPIHGEASFIADLSPKLPGVNIDVRFYLDGLPLAAASENNAIKLDTQKLSDGYHELRAVSYARGPLVQSVQNQLAIEVNNHGRAVRITDPAPRAAIDPFHPMALHVDVDDKPDRLEVVHNGRVLASSEGVTNSLSIDPLRLGAGPVRLFVVARYADGMKVQSLPLNVEIQRAHPSPALQAVRADLLNAERSVRPDGSAAERTGGTLEAIGENGQLFTPASTNHIPDLILLADFSGELRALSARITIPSTRPVHPKSELAGLVFGYESPEHYDFFILHGGPSAWSFGRCRNGRMEFVIERGALILNGTRHHIELLFDDQGATAYVNGESIATWAEATAKGRIGVLAIRQPVLIEDFVYQPETP